MLCKVELLVPYADGGSLAELHELAGDLSRDRTPPRACASARCVPEARRPSASPDSPSRPSVLAVVAAAGEDTPLLAREQLVEVRLGDLVEVELQLAGKLGDIPEDVPELLGHRLAPLGGDLTAVVANHLLRVIGELARLAGQPERRVGERLVARVLRGAVAKGAGTRIAPRSNLKRLDPPERVGCGIGGATSDRLSTVTKE